MKNVLAKGLIFGVLAGAFCVNCGDVSAKPALMEKDYAKRNQIKKDAAEKQLKKAQEEVNKRRRQLEGTTDPKKRAKLEKELRDAQGRMGNARGLVQHYDGKLNNIVGRWVNVEQCEGKTEELEKNASKAKNAFKNFKTRRTKADAEEVVKYSLLTKELSEKILEEMGVKKLKASSMEGRNLGGTQDTTNLGNPTCGRPGDGDYYLNTAGNNSGSRSNEYNNRIIPGGGGRIDYRKDPNFRYNTTISQYSGEPIGQDPDWVIQDERYYRTGVEGSSAQGNREIQRTPSQTRLGVNSSGPQSRVLNRNSSQGNLGNYSPAKKSDLDWDSDGGYGDTEYH